MKLVLVALFSSIFLISSCGTEPTPVSAPTEPQTTTALTEHAAGMLHLNQGQKWQTDNNTKLHANKLGGLIQAFDNSGDTKLPAFCNLSEAINNELNNLISDCKMEGPEHDALHLWLDPVLRDAEQLKNATTDQEAAMALAKLRADVQKFNQFFK
ncbi:MAG: hypothetical protein JST36_10735 [Bacteroidetes bacterium]|nr:hypothetical protein [Bacteroidota bacterium]